MPGGSRLLRGVLRAALHAGRMGGLRLIAVLIFGSRDLPHLAPVWTVLNGIAARRALEEAESVLVIEGGCPTGADLYANQWAESSALPARARRAGFESATGGGRAGWADQTGHHSSAVSGDAEERSMEPITERPAEPGERCLLLADHRRPPRWRVRPHRRLQHPRWRRDRTGPCPFCGGPRHTQSRCPRYRLRLKATHDHQEG